MLPKCVFQIACICFLYFLPVQSVLASENRENWVSYQPVNLFEIILEPEKYMDSYVSVHGYLYFDIHSYLHLNKMDGYFGNPVSGFPIHEATPRINEIIQERCKEGYVNLTGYFGKTPLYPAVGFSKVKIYAKGEDLSALLAENCFDYQEVYEGHSPLGQID